MYRNIFLSLCISILCRGVFTSFGSAQVTVTPGGSALLLLQNADRAGTGLGANPQWAAFSMRILENNNTPSFAAIAPNQTDATLILTAPDGREFNPGVGTLTLVGLGITAGSLVVTPDTIEVTITTSANINTRDRIDILNVEVRPISNISIPQAGNILRLSSNPGNFIVDGVVEDSTNFGSLSKQIGVGVGPGINAQAITADRAANSISPTWTLVGNITINETQNNYGNQSFRPNQTDVTLILTAPDNREFNPGVGSVAFVAGRDTSNVSMVVTASTIEITFTTDSTPTTRDQFTISSVQVRALDGSTTSGPGYLKRLPSNPGTAIVDAMMRNNTVEQYFGLFGQVAGAINRLVITLPGQTFVDGVGNTGTPIEQTPGNPFVISSITATDQHFNTVSSYAGAKTLNWLDPNTGTGSFVTAVSFTAGVSTTTLNTTLRQAQTTTLTVRDGASYGYASSSLTVASAGSVDIGSPSGLTFTGIMVHHSDQDHEKTFDDTGDYFFVDDSQGADAGYYTTLSCSDLTYGDDTIPKSHIAFKTNGSIAVIAGSANGNVTSDIGTVYQNCGSILSFIRRDTAANAGVTGIYGQHLIMQLTVPAWQNPGSYIGTITYTLIEN